MRIAVGSDHRGFEVKKRILLLLTRCGFFLGLRVDWTLG